MGDELTVGSLFAGIGGFDLGFERAGMRTVWFCEQDPFCQRVLAKHWPGVPCFPDVCALRGDELPSIDVLCGGFPCQDLSLAGKGAGLEGERSGLWSEYARLIGELRPRYVVVENVSALLSRGLGRVLGDLAEIGYDAEWDCIPASAFGAPHQRDRIWLVAYPNGGGLGAGVADIYARQPNVEGCGDDVADSAHVGYERPGQTRDGGLGSPDGGSGGRGSTTDAHCDQYEGTSHALGRAASAELRDHWAVEPAVGRVANGVPARVDRIRSLGNALVPQIAEWIGRRIIEWERMNCPTVKAISRG